MPRQQTLYEKLGGKDGICRLVETYLDLLQNDTKYVELKSHYVRGFDHYRERMLEYLSGFFGGPAVYAQKHGMPQLREHHQNIHITAALRDLWFDCMMKAVDTTVSETELRGELESAFWHMADGLRNA